jgi:DNA-binding beta-propeller fold protein YncE
VYIADSGNDPILKFDSNGNFITKWGSFGMDNGDFYNPVRIAVDSEAYVYINDSRLNSIQKFDSNGNFITKWRSIGTRDREDDDTLDIAVDSSTGYVYVVDQHNTRIQVFAPVT